MFKRRKKGPLLELQLLDSERIEAKLKRCSDFPHKYRVKKNTYVFPLACLDVLDRAKELGIEVEEIPEYVRFVPSQSPSPECPPDLTGLYDFQKEGVLSAIRWGRACLFDEMVSFFVPFFFLLLTPLRTPLRTNLII